MQKKCDIIIILIVQQRALLSRKSVIVRLLAQQMQLKSNLAAYKKKHGASEALKAVEKRKEDKRVAIDNRKVVANRVRRAVEVEALRAVEVEAPTILATFPISTLEGLDSDSRSNQSVDDSDSDTDLDVEPCEYLPLQLSDKSPS